MSPKRSIYIEIAMIQWFSQTILSSQLNSLLTSFSISSEPYTTYPTPHTSIYSTYFLSFNNQMTKLKYCYSHQKSFDFMFWIVLFVFLNHLNIPHTPNPLFHPNSFFSSLTHSLISFKSYTVSCITNLDNSVHPFHFPSSSPFSSHTHYQSAFKILCNTIYPSFSTKKCT